MAFGLAAFPGKRRCSSCRRTRHERVDVRPFVVAVLIGVALLAALALLSLLLI